MSLDTLITGGTVVTEQGAMVQDLVMAGEHIVAIGPGLASQYPRAHQVNAVGCYVIPGGIDPHTHMEMPFMGTTSSDDFETGTRAALFGGTTTIIDFAMQRPGDSLLATYQQWRDKAEKAVADYSFHVAITDFTANTAAEMVQLVTQEGIRSFKVFMAYKRALMVGDDTLLNILDTAAQLGAKVLAHCEHGDMVDWLIQRAKAQGHTGPKYHALTRPPLVEAEATGRFCDLAQLAGGLPYVVHLSCEEALQRVRQARLTRQQQVWVETCIQYLTLDDRLYDTPGFEAAKWVFSPPLRSAQDCQALWEALGQGEIDTVATDHCPFCMDQKAAGQEDFSLIPNGMPGVEHRIALLYSEGVLKGRLTVPQWVAISSTNAARIFDLYPRKGVLAVGTEADVVIFDPTVEQVITQAHHHMRCDYSAFEGRRVKGQVRQVWRRGELAVDVTVDPNHCRAARGSGRFLARNNTHLA
jgi:dihydropyrimidinase